MEENFRDVIGVFLKNVVLLMFLTVQKLGLCGKIRVSMIKIKRDLEDIDFDCEGVLEISNLVCLYFFLYVCIKVIQDLKIYS